MAPSHVYLPDGQSFTVQPVFGGLFFKSNDLNTHPTPFPAGWSVSIHTEDAGGEERGQPGIENHATKAESRQGSHRFTNPTLQNDTLFISSISNPSSDDFKPHASPSRQIALMLYVSLYWYFQQQPEPSPHVSSERSKYTPSEARPRGEWRINIKRDGIFRTKNMIPKLERMGLITSFDTSVGTGLSEKEHGWDRMFVTRRMFWQIHSGIFLFTLQPLRYQSSYPGSPVTSRPTSPTRTDSSNQISSFSHMTADIPGGPILATSSMAPSFPIGPYYSASHLPTYYPPPPLQYTMTNNIRHPRRQKPAGMGETFYSRFVPSVGKYISFRVASLSRDPVPHFGPVSTHEKDEKKARLCALSDDALMQMWLSNPRVSAFWGGYHPSFLSDALKSPHSFPAIGLWDGVPFAFFELYWVKEDALGQQMGNDAQDFDRGIHVFVGEDWARGQVTAWLSSLVHYCWQADNRTMNICLEPRVDNTRFINLLQDAGFAKERQVTFPHKQSWLCRLRRETWEGPAL
ncbi:acyl-CoA N-acyltransferase [Xylariaceae sp. FL1019]|nr:acyl-CoA N-acyltransferase [Xylariaceae sp. FL1019]